MIGNAIGNFIGARRRGVSKPAAPLNLAASVVDEVSIGLTWDAVTGADSYKIYYGTDGVTFASSTTSATNSKTVEGLTADTTYYFYVVAVKGSAEGLVSSTVNAKTLTPSVTEKWYGVEIDESSSNPDVIRIAGDGEMGLHATLPIQSKMKGCLVADNGTVNYYLNPTDWTKKADNTASNLDGTDGQVMVEIPDFYYKVSMDTPSAGKHQIVISEYPLTGYTAVAKRYISAYEAAINRTTSTLASIKNLSTTYRGGDNTSAYDGNANSLLGMPLSNLSLANLRTYARNRGTGWNVYSYDDHKWIYWLYVIEYATRNSQKALDATLTAEGYKKGGMGTGVTTAASSTEWTDFNGGNPFILCGHSDSLANASGAVDCVKTDFSGAGTPRTFSVPRYRGIENPFGHIMKITDGIIIQNQSVADGGKLKVYATENAAIWNDSDFSSYDFRGDVSVPKGTMSKAVLGPYADMLALEVNGSDNSAYYCDYHYTSAPAATTKLVAGMFGGRPADGGQAGMCYNNTDRTPGYVGKGYGCRLRYQ